MFQHLIKPSKSIAGASFVLALATLASALVALFRNRLLASRFGAGVQLDIYFAALRLPDFLSTLLITGTLSIAVIPLFNYYRGHSQEEGWQFVSALFRWFCLFSLFLSTFLIIFAPGISKLIAPGFDVGQRTQMVTMMRIMLLGPFFLSLSTIASSVLQSFQHFFITSLAPIFYNLGIIVGILLFVPLWGLSGLGWGVVLGSFLHLAIQGPAIFVYRFRYRKAFSDQRIALKKLIQLGLPRIIGVSANQLILVVVTSLASLFSAGSISIYNFAADIAQGGTRLIGLSFTTAVFPVLAYWVAHQDKEKFLENFSAAFRQIVYLIAPASILVFILRAHLVRIILGAGNFDWVDTRLTAACLGILSLSIFAQSLVTLISRTFAAWHDTKTPAKISVGTLFFHVGFSFLFVHFLGQEGIIQDFVRTFLKLEGLEDIRVVGLSLAFSLATIIQFIWLLFKLRQKIDGGRRYFSWISRRQIFFSLLALVFSTYGFLYLSAPWIKTTTFWGITGQTALAISGGLLAYLLVSWLFHSSELKEIFQGIRKEFQKEKENEEKNS
jgi:putative peptidoglycan lipid II flippase